MRPAGSAARWCWPRRSRSSILGALLVGVVAVAAAFAASASYARKETVVGWLTPEAGLVRAAAQRGGVATEVLVEEGASVAAGAPLAVMRLSADTAAGDAGLALLRALTAQTEAAAGARAGRRRQPRRGARAPRPGPRRRCRRAGLPRRSDRLPGAPRRPDGRRDRPRRGDGRPGHPAAGRAGSQAHRGPGGAPGSGVAARRGDLAAARDRRARRPRGRDPDRPGRGRGRSRRGARGVGGTHDAGAGGRSICRRQPDCRAGRRDPRPARARAWRPARPWRS